MPPETFGILALLPPLLAIGLAMYTREVLVSLFAGVWIGALMVADWNPISATATSLDWIVSVIRTPFDAKFIVLIMFLGAGAAFIYESGGIIALQRWLGSEVNTARESQILTWVIGVFIFFDSYTSTVVTGNATRELSNENYSSREMHSYVLDSTTSPVTTFGPISNWIGYQVSMIIAGFEALQITMDQLGITAYGLFLRSIPWNIYCFMAFIMVGFIAITQRFYGSMLDAEWRARKKKQTMREGATPLSDIESDLGDPSEENPTLVNFFVPIILLLVVGIVAMWWLGGGYKPNIGITEAFQQTDAASALLYASFVFMISGFAGAIGYGTMDLEDATDTIINGFNTMMIAIAIIIMAWSIGLAAEKVGTAAYIVNLVTGTGIPADWLPLIIFGVAMFIAFSTGTSWGTMAILTPIAIPLGYNLGGVSILPVIIGALFGGAIWGDHCSPISDTTVMSSIFAGSDHIDHVNTQIPLACTAAGVAAVIFILFALGLKSAIVSLPLAFVITIISVYILNKWDSRRKNIPEVMPSVQQIESEDFDIEAIERGERSTTDNGGKYEMFGRIPAIALIVVIIYISIVLVFASLGGTSVFF